MNPSVTAEFSAGLARELRGFLSLCEEIFSLATRERQTLAGEPGCPSGSFNQQRKNLIQPLESALISLRNHRTVWQQVIPSARGHSEEVKTLFQDIQNLLMKILLLDRENQQAMLRRGVVPPGHLPAAAGQNPHFVAGLYQRFSPR
jgi:hypothetical protein